MQDNVISQPNAQPAAVPVITKPPIDPANDPLYDPKFFNLTVNPDSVQLSPGLLNNTPGGLRALAGDDFLQGSNSAELINGNEGNDTVKAGCNNDTIKGGKGDDVLYGECGSDILQGDAGDDYLFGGTNSDVIRGGKGNDNLVGDTGNDTLTGDTGVDKLWGGIGADVFVLRRDTATPFKQGTTPQPSSDGFTQPQEVTDDFILDYNQSENDVIGLTGGMTVNDLILTEKTMTIGDRRDYDSKGPYPLGEPRTLDFQIETVKVTQIKDTKTGNILGLVKNVLPSQLNFVSVSDQLLG
jgi:serralysin